MKYVHSYSVASWYRLTLMTFFITTTPASKASWRMWINKLYEYTNNYNIHIKFEVKDNKALRISNGMYGNLPLHTRQWTVHISLSLFQNIAVSKSAVFFTGTYSMIDLLIFLCRIVPALCFSGLYWLIILQTPKSSGHHLNKRVMLNMFVWMFRKINQSSCLSVGIFCAYMCIYW